MSLFNIINKFIKKFDNIIKKDYQNSLYFFLIMIIINLLNTLNIFNNYIMQIINISLIYVILVSFY